MNILYLIYNGGEQMRYLSVTEIAKKWDVSERSVRNYCAQGRVNGAFLTGKTWNIPENVEKPERSNKKKEQPITLLDILQEQKASKYSGGIYHKTQIELTYNSNHIEGNRLTHDQTRYIFETNTIGVEKDVLNVDDVIETANHFRCIDMIIDNAKKACELADIVPLILPIRGGTDGCQLSFKGLPCPNLGTGGHAYHGPYEHITVEGMDMTVAMLVKLVGTFTE